MRARHEYDVVGEEQRAQRMRQPWHRYTAIQQKARPAAWQRRCVQEVRQVVEEQREGLLFFSAQPTNRAMSVRA